MSNRNIKPDIRIGRWLWRVVALLVLIGVFAVVRRTTQLVPILVNGYHPPAATSSPMIKDLADPNVRSSMRQTALMAAAVIHTSSPNPQHKVEFDQVRKRLPGR